MSFKFTIAFAGLPVVWYLTVTSCFNHARTQSLEINHLVVEAFTWLTRRLLKQSCRWSAIHNDQSVAIGRTTTLDIQYYQHPPYLSWTCLHPASLSLIFESRWILNAYSRPITIIYGTKKSTPPGLGELWRSAAEPRARPCLWSW